MADFSFDVVSKVDLNLIEEAISVAKKEVTNRYDFKGSNPDLERVSKENLIKIRGLRKGSSFFAYLIQILICRYVS